MDVKPTIKTAQQDSVVTLKQRHFPFGTRELILRGHQSLTIKEKSLFRKDETTIPLEILQASPASSKTFSVKWLLNSIALIILSIIVYRFAESYHIPPLHIMTLLLVIFSVYALYQFFENTSNLIIYRNAYTNEHYLYLWNNSPNKRAFQAFLNTLNQRIDGFETAKAKSTAEKIELYSQHLAFLHKENIIDNKQLSQLSRKVYNRCLEES